MGDVGSGFLGFILCSILILTSRDMPVEVLPILSGVFLVDSTVTLIRRVVSGDRWFEAHRTHAYQILSRKFGSHKTVTLIVMAINVLWLLPCAFVASRLPRDARGILFLSLCPLVIMSVYLGAGKRAE
jgi:Fuc2NAc and GlcNAc transferase